MTGAEPTGRPVPRPATDRTWSSTTLVGGAVEDLIQMSRSTHRASVKACATSDDD